MEEAACAPNQQTCLLRSEVQAPPPPPSLWLLSSSPALENGYYPCNLFPQSGESQIILLSLLWRSCQVPSSLLCRNVWRYLRCALLSQVERNGLHTGVSISVEPALPGLIASSHATMRGSQEAWEKQSARQRRGTSPCARRHEHHPDHPQDLGLFWESSLLVPRAVGLSILKRWDRVSQAPLVVNDPPAKAGDATEMELSNQPEATAEVSSPGW